MTSAIFFFIHCDEMFLFCSSFSSHIFAFTHQFLCCILLLNAMCARTLWYCKVVRKSCILFTNYENKVHWSHQWRHFRVFLMMVQTGPKIRSEIGPNLKIRVQLPNWNQNKVYIVPCMCAWRSKNSIFFGNQTEFDRVGARFRPLFHTACFFHSDS